MALLLGRGTACPHIPEVLAMRYQTSGLPNGLGISGIGPGRWPPWNGRTCQTCVLFRSVRVVGWLLLIGGYAVSVAGSLMTPVLLAW